MMQNFMNQYQMNGNNYQMQYNYLNNSQIHSQMINQNVLLRLQPNLLGIQSEQLQQPQEKYKTELCKNWEKQGTCPYGEKCRFAHGKTDLKIHQLQQENFNYKSKDCLQYHKMGTCTYGLRCLFRHDERTVYEIQQEFRIAEKYQQSQEGKQSSIKRLQIFEEIAPQDSDYQSHSDSTSIDSQDKYQYNIEILNLKKIYSQEQFKSSEEKKNLDLLTEIEYNLRNSF